jgi:hypothetical protein
MRVGEVETARVFVVRLTTGNDTEALRGHVRDGVTGAYRAFTEWHELTSFLADQIDQDCSSKPAPRREPSKEKKP